jgi:cytochrome c-type biogenesis protein CcmH/NrfG
VLEREDAPAGEELPRTRGGRVERKAADAAFARRRAEVEQAPEDWRAWYRLAVAYGDAGDVRRGRRAMRHAIRLYDAQRAG